MNIAYIMAGTLARGYVPVAIAAAFYRLQYGGDLLTCVGMALITTGVIGPVVFAGFDGLDAWIKGDRK